MFSYENGLMIAFYLWLFGVIITLIKINSKLEKNLNRVGQRLSWLTLMPKEMEESDQRRTIFKSVGKFLVIASFGFISIFLSWLYVAWFVGIYTYSLSKDYGAPQRVKEFRWKMKNADLAFDQIVKEIMKMNEQDVGEFEVVRAQFLEGMENRGLKIKHQ